VTISLPVDAPVRESVAGDIVAIKASRSKEDFDGTFRKTA
jgi:hypothetical protein